MSKPRINVTVTDETVIILKQIAKKWGISMGAAITMLALEKQREMQALGIVDIYNKEIGKTEI